MNMISYAQNFEDVMLWRALKHIENGFYIDIGAQDPVTDSVSLAFYEYGWRGVHVEPNRLYSKMIKSARPDEIVEQVAVGMKHGTLIFYEFDGTGLSTADPEIAEGHMKAGYKAVRTDTPIVRLDSLLEKYGANQIHWLKIDVEGMEKSVLEGWRISACRPWILVVESMHPSTQEKNYKEWEPGVLDKGYLFAYFDGLNRFYIHHDHSDLVPFFNAPPNVFDEFCLSGRGSNAFCRLIERRAQDFEAVARKTETKLWHAEDRAQRAEDLVKQAEDLAQQAEDTTHQMHARARIAEDRAIQAEALSQQAEKAIIAICNSWSWRITAPLRRIKSRTIAFGNHIKLSRAKLLSRRIGHSAIRGTLSYLYSQPALHSYCVNLAIALKLYHPLRSLYYNLLDHPQKQDALQVDNGDISKETSMTLTPRAMKIFFDLKAAIQKHRDSVY